MAVAKEQIKRSRAWLEAVRGVRRRLAPPRFSQEAEAAARRIQRWFRREWCMVEVWDAATCACRLRPRRREQLVLVEPCGRSYAFDPKSLVAIFLATALFEHPITRRALLTPELKRLHNKLDSTSSFLVQCTFDYRAQARGTASAEESLATWLQGTAGEHLDQALLAAEEDAENEVIDDFLEAYEDAMAELRARVPASVPETLRQHECVLRRRRRNCDERHWLSIYRSLTAFSKLMSRSARGCGEGAPRSILGTWISAELR